MRIPDYEKPINAVKGSPSTSFDVEKVNWMFKAVAGVGSGFTDRIHILSAKHDQ